MSGDRWLLTWLLILPLIKGQGCGTPLWPPPPLFNIPPPPPPCIPTSNLPPPQYPCRSCSPFPQLPPLVQPPRVFPEIPPESNSTNPEGTTLPPPVLPYVYRPPTGYYYPYGRPLYPTGPPQLQPNGCQWVQPPQIYLPPPPTPAPLPPLPPPLPLFTLPPPTPPPLFTLPPPPPPLFLPPLQNCCTPCQQCPPPVYSNPYSNRGPKSYVAKTFHKLHKDQKPSSDPFCSSQRLKSIMALSKNETISVAKLRIQRESEKAVQGAIFHVVCSSTDLEYATRTEEYCTVEASNGVCYAFRS